MRLRTKMIAGISMVLVIIFIFISVDQKNRTDVKYSKSNNDTSHQQEPNHTKAAENKQTEVVANDRNHVSANSEHESSGAAVNTEKTMAVNKSAETGDVPEVDEPGRESLTPQTENAETIDEKENSTAGLHFSSREEAIAFGFSRFTAEEIAIYHRAAENGLTPEQEEMAIQLAYSRFTPEEIAALKEAMGK